MHYKIHSYRQQNQEEVIKHFHIEIKQQKLTRGKYLILIKIYLHLTLSSEAWVGTVNEEVWEERDRVKLRQQDLS